MPLDYEEEMMVEEGEFDERSPYRKDKTGRWACSAGVVFAIVVMLVVTGLFMVGKEQPVKVIATLEGLGKVRGVVKGSNEVFRGVHYAKKPKLWENPIPIEPWDDVISAEHTLPHCVDGSGEGGEDCLYVDVYAPSKEGSYPVLVFLPGGCYSYGNTAHYDGATLAAEHDAVIVVVSSRLSVFGYLSSPDGGLSGWYGYEDQLLALRWVSLHIKGFKGDSSSVTLMGQSSGGCSVALHYTTGFSAGLFHRVVLQSGGFGSWSVATQEAAFKQYNAVAAATQCSTVACLKQKPSKDLAATLEGTSICLDGCAIAPPIDGHYLVAHPMEILSTQNYTLLPLLTGACDEDGSDYTTVPQDATQADYTEWYQWRFPNITGKPLGFDASVASNYPREGGKVKDCNEYCLVASQVESDYDYICPSRVAGEMVAARGGEVYQYLFTRRNPVTGKAGHSCELPFFWPYHPSTDDPAWMHRGTDEIDESLSKAVQKHWFSFVKGGLVEEGVWPAFTVDNQSVMELGAVQSVGVRGGVGGRCDVFAGNVEYFTECL